MMADHLAGSSAPVRWSTPKAIGRRGSVVLKKLANRSIRFHKQRDPTIPVVNHLVLLKDGLRHL